jgi:hypothetical protein
MHLVDDEGGRTHSHAHTWYTAPAHTGEMQHYIHCATSPGTQQLYLSGGRVGES